MGDEKVHANPPNDKERRASTLTSGNLVAQAPGVNLPFIVRAARNSFYSGLGTISNFALSFLFAGLTVRYLGEARSGFFMMLTALTAINALLGDFGLGTPAVRRVAMLNARGDLNRARLVVGSVFTASLASCLIVVVPILLFFSSIFAWSRLDGAFQDDAFWATVCTLFSFILAQASNPWRATYNALERYDLISAFNTAYGLLSGVLGIAALALIPTMTAVSVVRLGISIVRFAMDAHFMGRLLKGMPWPTWAWDEIRSMLSFGGWVYASTIGIFLIARINSLILTTLLGSAALPYYELPQRVYNQVHAALDGQSGFLFPMLASAGDDMVVQMKRMEDRLRWFIALASAMIYGAIAIVGPDLLGRLVNPRFGELVSVSLRLACIQGFVQAQAIIPYYTSWALGAGKPNAIKELVQGALVTVTALVLIPRVGVVGASAAQLWAIPVVVVHTLWIRQLTWGGTDQWGWLRSMTSPTFMIAIWFCVFEVGIRIVGSSAPVTYSLAVSGGGVGLMAVWMIERFIFPGEQRWDTMVRAMVVTVNRIGRRVVLAQ